MSIPKLDIPTFELTLPSSGKKVKYRPFLVKEYKTLQMMKESSPEEVHRIALEIVDICTFNKLKVSTLPNFDVEYIFMQLRAKSLGENVDLVVNCECGFSIPYSMPIEKVTLKRVDTHTPKFMVTDTVGLKMKYPPFNVKTKSLTPEDLFTLVASCVESFYTKDGEYHEVDQSELDEVKDFLENLNPKQFALVEKFFETIPKLTHAVYAKCPSCGNTNEANLEGLLNFFV